MQCDAFQIKCEYSFVLKGVNCKRYNKMGGVEQNFYWFVAGSSNKRRSSSACLGKFFKNGLDFLL